MILSNKILLIVDLYIAHLSRIVCSREITVIQSASSSLKACMVQDDPDSPLVGHRRHVHVGHDRYVGQLAGFHERPGSSQALVGTASYSSSISLSASFLGEQTNLVASGRVDSALRSMAVRQACSTARSRVAMRVSRAVMAWRLRRP